MPTNDTLQPAPIIQCAKCRSWRSGVSAVHPARWHWTMREQVLRTWSFSFDLSILSLAMRTLYSPSPACMNSPNTHRSAGARPPFLRCMDRNLRNARPVVPFCVPEGLGLSPPGVYMSVWAYTLANPTDQSKRDFCGRHARHRPARQSRPHSKEI